MPTNKERIKELLEQAVALECEADDLLKGLDASLSSATLSAKLSHLAFLLNSTVERYEYLNAERIPIEYAFPFISNKDPLSNHPFTQKDQPKPWTT